MEPTRTPLTFEPIDGAQVVLLRQGIAFHCPLWHLGGECFAEFRTALIPLYREGFTILDDVRWEHFTNLPVNLRVNALGRIVVCPS